jgi:hypothetical protein
MPSSTTTSAAPRTGKNGPPPPALAIAVRALALALGLAASSGLPSVRAAACVPLTLACVALARGEKVPDLGVDIYRRGRPLLSSALLAAGYKRRARARWPWGKRANKKKSRAGQGWRRAMGCCVGSRHCQCQCVTPEME